MLLQAGQLSHNETISLGPKKEQCQFSPSSLEKTSIHWRRQILDYLNSHPASGIPSRGSFPSSAEHLEDLSDIVPLLSYWSPPSMASESSERLPQKATAARRTDTPPRSIFDDYQSAYQSILSPAQTSTGTSKVVEATNTPGALSELSPPYNPFADLSPPTHAPRTPSHGTQTGSVAGLMDRRNSRLPSSPKSKRRINFSRPMGVSPSSDQATNPANAVLRDPVSIFDHGSPRRLSQARSPNTKQPNLHGARGRVEKSSTVGSIVKRYGGESDSTRKSGESDQDVEVRSSLDVLGSGQGLLGNPSLLRSSPAGQAPSIPLPPDPSYVAARGLIGETLSEASLYENTEKLLNLTQTSGTAAFAGKGAPRQPYQAADSLEGRLNSEFSWMGNKGKTAFRDLSTKELKQLRKSIHGQSGGLAGEGVDVSPNDELHGDQYLLTDAVYQLGTAEQRSNALDELVKADARRAQILSEHITTHTSEQDPKSCEEPADVGDKSPEAGAHITHGLQTDPVLDFGGLQSSSSRGVSLRDSPFRPGLYMDESSLVSLVGRESADAARLSAIAKGKNVIRSVENDADDDLVTEADDNEGGEWETVGESGMRRELRTQASLGRDTSGSSLANVSSNESTEDRPAPSPWDPLRLHPALITPPTKAVIHQRRDNISGVHEPATVPRYAPAHGEGFLPRKLNRISSSTPALTFTATQPYQRKRENSPTYRHPTPLSGEHQNPFISSPPLVDVQTPGLSYELSEFSDKRKDKRQAVYADTRSLHQQIHTPTPDRTKNRLENPFAIQDTSSDKSVDGSYSTFYPTNLAVDGSSILNPNSHHTPKSAKSFTPGSIKRTKTFLTGSPRRMIVSLNCKH